jgi:poly(3-hydroxybutyrate) depolymerase
MMRKLFAVAAVAVPLCAAGAEPLPALSADTGSPTVSGMSSGGYMAIQLQVAHSSRVKGVAALAAGPYYCAQGSLWAAYYNCLTPGAWSPLPAGNTLKAQAERYASEGRIDATANLGAARVWLFSGSRDRTLERPVVEAAAQFYALFGAKNIPIHSRPAGHAMVTESAGTACGTTEPPFINDCDYDAAGALLAHLLGPLKPAATKADGRLVLFDQKPFADGNPHALSLADAGYAYLPVVCTTQPCKVHVAFHGCRQNADEIGDRFAREAGYNRWADTNRLIVLYPQTTTRYGLGVSAGRWSYAYNPRGCWDWWGYTGAQYATKAAPQIRAVIAMVDRLGAPGE